MDLKSALTATAAAGLAAGLVLLFTRTGGKDKAATATKDDLKQLEAKLKATLASSSSSPKASPLRQSPSVEQPIIPVPELTRSQQKKILVSGGAGFVGSHLVDALMMQGHIVYVLDNLFTGRRKNIAHWLGHPNFQFFQHDVVNPFLIEVDEIYHLACPASPPHYQYNAIKTIKCCVLGTLNMLGLAKRCKARLLFTSTSEVYGDPLVHPQVETYWGNVNPIGLRSCYDEGKRIAETMCFSYKREGFVDIRVARIFNTFGPRMHPDDGRVVSNFIKQALQGESLTIYGDGSNTRSFQYVSDLIRGLIALMASDYSNPVNIGNPEEFTILQFAEKIKDMISPSAGRIQHLPQTSDDPCKRRPDITVAKAKIGWQPQVKVEEGLKQTILYFRHELQAEILESDPPLPLIWVPEVPDTTLGCMATRRAPPVYK